MKNSISIHEQKRRRFTRGGAGVFTCHVCKRRTRETDGDHAQTGLCAWCFELAGMQNSISDNGVESYVAYRDECRRLLRKLEKAGASSETWLDLVATLDEYDSKEVKCSYCAKKTKAKDMNSNGVCRRCAKAGIEA